MSRSALIVSSIFFQPEESRFIVFLAGLRVAFLTADLLLSAYLPLSGRRTTGSPGVRLSRDSWPVRPLTRR